MIIREVNINDAYALSEIYKYYVDNFCYSFEYEAPSAEEFAGRIKEIMENIHSLFARQRRNNWICLRA